MSLNLVLVLQSLTPCLLMYNAPENYIFIYKVTLIVNQDVEGSSLDRGAKLNGKWKMNSTGVMALILFAIWAGEKFGYNQDWGYIAATSLLFLSWIKILIDKYSKGKEEIK